MKKLYIDTETTGLDPKIHGIVSLAYIIESDTGEPVATGEIKMNTFEYRNKYLPKALEVNGYTVEQIQKFPSPKEALKEFDQVLCEHSGGEKYTITAYNAKFDKDMVEALYEYVYPGRYPKVLSHKVIDTLQVVMLFQDIGLIDTGKKQNLAAVAAYFGIEHDAHDAASDNVVQRAIYRGLTKAIKDSNIEMQ